MLSASQAYFLLPILSVIITCGVAYWLGARGFNLAVAAVMFALPVNMLIIKLLRSYWRFSIYLSSEEPPAE
jgi:hypothetical protein